MALFQWFLPVPHDIELVTFVIRFWYLFGGIFPVQKFLANALLFIEATDKHSLFQLGICRKFPLK